MSTRAKRATIQDVARRAAVSIGTVSNFLNATHPVNPATVERIQQAMVDLNYRPSGPARGLRSRRSQTIGVVIPATTNPFFATIAWHIEQACARVGFGMMLCNTGGTSHLEASCIEMFLQKWVDGIVAVWTTGDPQLIERILALGVPVVEVDREAASAVSDTVVADNYGGGQLSARHLLGLGHRRIGCVLGPSTVSTIRDRLAGFRDEMALAGASLADDHVVFSDAYARDHDSLRQSFDVTDGYRAALDLLRHHPTLTAIFAANDMIALAVIRAANDLNRAVPATLSVIGFDDISLAELTTPRLTTVRQPIGEIATTTVTLIQNRLAEPERPFDCRVLPVELVARQSTAPIDGGDYRSTPRPGGSTSESRAPPDRPNAV